MPNIPGSVPVAGFIAPTDSSDTYATHDALYGRGGHRTVASVADRNAIPTDRRAEGMLVFVAADGETYKLRASPWAGTNDDWVAFGNPAAAQTFPATAGATVHGDRVVKVVEGLAYEVDTTSRADMLLVTGISQGSAMIGEPVTVRTSGERTEPSWSWNPGILFAGADGVLTQVQPTTGWSMEVARSISATRIIVGMTPGIWRGN